MAKNGKRINWLKVLAAFLIIGGIGNLGSDGNFVAGVVGIVGGILLFRYKKKDPTIASAIPAHPRTSTPAKKAISVKFTVRAWDEFLDNIVEWQKKNARDQWIGANFTNKPLYQYAWKTVTDSVSFIPEPENEFDQYAIGVYLNGEQVGYVPRPKNETHYNELLNAKTITADIHGGSSKYMDEYGDLIVDKNDPVVEIKITL